MCPTNCFRILCFAEDFANQEISCLFVGSAFEVWNQHRQIKTCLTLSLQGTRNCFYTYWNRGGVDSVKPYSDIRKPLSRINNPPSNKSFNDWSWRVTGERDNLNNSAQIIVFVNFTVSVTYLADRGGQSEHLRKNYFYPLGKIPTKPFKYYVEYGEGIRDT